MDKERHIRIIAWIHLVLGGLVLFAAVLASVAVLLGGLFSGEILAAFASPIAAIVIAIVIAVFAVPGFLAAKGLLEGKSWSRVLAMILAVLHFTNFPLGTLFCIYSFWVLWGKEADPYFEPSYSTYHE